MLLLHRFVRGPIFPLAAALLLAWIAMPAVYAVSADELSKQAQEKIEREDYIGALSDLDRAIAAAPEEARYYYYRAVARDGANNPTGAMADVNKALRLNVEQADAYELRARLKVQAGDREGGIADYDAAITLKPLSLFRLQINRGVLLYQSGRHAEVIAAMDDVLGETTFPEYAAAGHMLRGMGRAGLHEYAAAVTDYTKALSYEFAHPGSAYFERAKAKFHLLDFEGARKDLSECMALQKDPDDPESYSEWFLFGCLMRDQDLEASTEAFERSYKMSPEHCRTALLMRHQILVAHRRHEGDELLKDAAKTWKNDAWRVKLAAFVLGEIEAEELEKAAEQFSAGANAVGVRCELFFYRAMMMKDGEDEETKRLIKEAIATNHTGDEEHTLARYIGKEVYDLSP